jgi:hypothetical protein
LAFRGPLRLPPGAICLDPGGDISGAVTDKAAEVNASRALAFHRASLQEPFADAKPFSNFGTCKKAVFHLLIHLVSPAIVLMQKASHGLAASRYGFEWCLLERNSGAALA